MKGFPVRNGKRETWRIETARKEYDEAEDYVKSIQKEDSYFEVLRRARLTENEAFRFMPFAHLRPTMSIAVREGNKIVEDIIEEVEFEEYKGFVFDLSVEHLRQYVCSDVVVHNSIYGWRGADIRNILDFEKDFPEAKVVKLEQNYRCTKRILEAANYVIANNENRKAKRLWTQNKLGDNIKFFRAETDQEEAKFIAYEVEKLLRDGYSHRDFAVLYRTNAMSRILEEAFVRQGIPYRVVGAFKFYDRKEIKDIISYLKFINNPQDTLSLERIINTPKRGIGDATLDKIRQAAERMSISFFDALNNLALVGISGRAESAIRKFTSLMNYFISIKIKLRFQNL
ncbi:3'-5' exonuclease [Caloramator sp. Dgby_cultured_2]|uniref:3'-5' exonuclease n=1 Tax=Caloramator sp. Dgby_cultured_2 TaxID=3029174 RepID=UPI00237D6A9A|nr:3'-5' exonuclease [Caloramator sp. Dgby_cultured_2]WDU82360.1 3'-5' exonuclease [Caloramator sp. Dgby_cultured_2]